VRLGGPSIILHYTCTYTSVYLQLLKYVLQYSSTRVGGPAHHAQPLEVVRLFTAVYTAQAEYDAIMQAGTVAHPRVLRGRRSAGARRRPNPGAARKPSPQLRALRIHPRPPLTARTGDEEAGCAITSAGNRPPAEAGAWSRAALCMHLLQSAAFAYVQPLTNRCTKFVVHVSWCWPSNLQDPTVAHSAELVTVCEHRASRRLGPGRCRSPAGPADTKCPARCNVAILQHWNSVSSILRFGAALLVPKSPYLTHARMPGASCLLRRARCCGGFRQLPVTGSGSPAVGACVHQEDKKTP
jgi:hypothetical protein